MTSYDTRDAVPNVRPTTTSGTASRRFRTAVVPLAAVGVALAADVIFDPVHHHVPLCPLHAMTGLWCPFCGGLRAAYLLAHGHIAAAASANLVLLVAVPWLAWRWINGVRGRPTRRLPGPAWWPAAAVIVALCIFTVVRNLPIGQFLAPAGS